MKKFIPILLSLFSVSAFAQIQADTPVNIAFGETAISSAEWLVQDSDITINGTLTFDSGVSQYAIKVAKKAITIGSTGVLRMNSNLSAASNKQNTLSLGAWAGAATITIEDGGKLYEDKITITATNSVINVYNPDGFNPVKSDYAQIYFYYDGKLNMYGAGAYNYIFTANTGKIATLGFSKNVDLNVMEYGNNNSFNLKLVDFTETNSIFLSSMVDKTECMLTLSELGVDKYAVSFYDGETLKKTITITGADLSDYSLEQATVDGVNGYVLAVAVPEPAEWAMIFGGIAFALAIYRRRK
ncbi:MAG: PEP-CTERM sorting domain-containing protein [Opitutales bacterium]|nr:PEP-CTERM sorting domain-containing protein [Opitutales bacterium]